MSFRMSQLTLVYIMLTLVAFVHGTTHKELLANNFQYFPGVGYYYLGKGNWSYGQSVCTGYGARLVVFNSQEEADTVANFVASSGYNFFYCGFYNLLDYPTFVTTEGFPLNGTGYSTWLDGYPSGDAAGTCGSFTPNTGELLDLPCDVDATGFVCEHQLWVDYTFYPNLGYYKIHTTGQGWAEAHETCQREGAHLVVIDSQEEYNTIMQIFQQYPNMPNTDTPNAVYIGIRAVYDEFQKDNSKRTYLTVFGSSVSNLGFVKWNTDEPNPGVKNLCGILDRNSQSYIMFPCDRKLAFFCEKKSEEYKPL